MAYTRKTLHLAAAALGDGEIIDVRGRGAVAVHFVNTGTPNGTVTFEGTIDGTNWIAVPMENASGSLVTTATGAGYFRLVRNHGLSQFRARISTYNSGNFTLLSGRNP